MNAETVEVNVAITEGTAGKDGINGKDGEKGEKGEKGDAFTFADFTPEQLASLKGEKGERGEKGDPGEGGGASIDWIQNTDKGVISIGKNQTLVHNTNPSLITSNSIVIGNDTRCADSGAYPITPERCVVIGHGTTVEDYYCCTLGNNISTFGQDAVAIGNLAQANYQGISIGSQSWCSNDAVAIGNNAQADSGNITLKSGNVEVKFSADGMTLNGNSIGGGSGSGGEYDLRKAVLKAVVYDTKYSGIDMQNHRSSCSSWDAYDEEGNHYTYYEYYNDFNSSGEWFYSFDCYGNSNVFNYCPIIKKFAAKIDNCDATNGMFYECKNLESFYTPSKLKNAEGMFYRCIKLKEFYADLSELWGVSSMFGYDSYSCTSLNVESVEHIANSIGESYSEIHIGMARELQWDNGDGKYQRCQDALQRIRNKGWTVYEIYSENY